jgi:hypothetical protein
MHIRKERHKYDEVEHSDGHSPDIHDASTRLSLRALVSRGSRKGAEKKSTASPRKPRPSSRSHNAAKDSVTQDRSRSKRRGSKTAFGLTFDNPESDRGSVRAPSRSSSTSSDDGLMVAEIDLETRVITTYNGKENRKKLQSERGGERRPSPNRKPASTIPSTRSNPPPAEESDLEGRGKPPVKGYSPLSS